MLETKTDMMVHDQSCVMARLASSQRVLPLSREAVRDVLRRAKKKQVYIATWDRSVVRVRLRLRPVYALGDKPDARKPAKMSNAERCRRYRAKQQVPVVSAPNSVWQLGSFL